MRLRWLKVDKLRNVAPGTRLLFGPRNVLLGQNATGKTTLLELVAAAASLNFGRFVHDEFDVTFEAQVDEHVVSVRFRNKRATWREQAELRIEPLPQRFEQAVEVSIRKLGEERALLTLRAEDGLLHSARSSPAPLKGSLLDDLFGTLFFSFEDRAREPDSNLLVDLDIGFVPIRRFDESLEYFRRLTEQRSAVVTFLRKSGIVTVVSDCLPADARTAFEQHIRSDADCSSVRLSSKEVKSLARVTQSLGFSNCMVAADREEKSGARTTFGSLRFEFTRPDGSVINHNLLSYGQKRLLAFLFYVGANQHVVVADELVNGLHHRWIEECLEAIGDRQAFLTSQNPLLLDFLTFNSAEEARSSFIQCRKEVTEQGEILTWANLSEQDSEEFFKGYEAGIQQVSEVLESRGLW